MKKRFEDAEKGDKSLVKKCDTHWLECLISSR